MYPVIYFTKHEPVSPTAQMLAKERDRILAMVMAEEEELREIVEKLKKRGKTPSNADTRFIYTHLQQKLGKASGLDQAARMIDADQS